MFDNLNTLAAISLRDAIEAAIAHQENAIRQKPLEGLKPDVVAYFEDQHKERMDAIVQLKKLRSAAHDRVFQSQKE
jgi:hypothetical protein